MGNSCATDASPALVRKTDDPAFEWKICGFSALLERGAIPASSALFCCCGYEWFLQVIPIHNKRGAQSPYVALCLVLSPTKLKSGYIIDAVFEVSMYNHSNGNYCGYKASYSFDARNTHSEKKCLIPLEQLLKSSDFLVDDSCAFAVGLLKVDVYSSKNMLLFMRKKSVVVQKKPIIVQNIFLRQKREIIKATCTWSINNFLDSKLPVHSPTFEVGGHTWHISMYPLGDQYINNSLSLYLYPHDPSSLPPECGMMIELTLSILDQRNGARYNLPGRFSFSSNISCWGWSDFILLWIWKHTFLACLAGSNCIVEADIAIIGSSTDG